MGLDEYFSSGPEREQPIFRAVHEHLESLGPLVVEPLSVGIYFKRARTFAVLAPKKHWESLTFALPRRVDHRLITRKPMRSGSDLWNVVNLKSPDDFDDEIRGWMVESYFNAPD